MGDLVFRSAAATVELGPPRLDDASDPYGGGGFEAIVQAGGLAATAEVFMLTYTWDELVAWFRDLAGSWRGFDGERRWRSIEGHLEISARVDSLGHVALTFVLAAGPCSTWDLRVQGLEVDAGEDLAALMMRVAGWAPAVP